MNIILKKFDNQVGVVAFCYLSEYTLLNEPPEELLDVNIASDYYSFESENEANKGYVDLQLMKQPGANVNYCAIIEFKYLSKANGTEANINKQLADAKGQLAKYSVAPKFKGMDNLKKWALVFVGDKCVRNVEV